MPASNPSSSSGWASGLGLQLVPGEHQPAYIVEPFCVSAVMERNGPVLGASMFGDQTIRQSHAVAEQLVCQPLPRFDHTYAPPVSHVLRSFVACSIGAMKRGSGSHGSGV